MSLLIYKVSEFEITHKREALDELLEILENDYDDQENIQLLMANPRFDNRDIDAIFIKNDAIKFRFLLQKSEKCVTNPGAKLPPKKDIILYVVTL